MNLPYEDRLCTKCSSADIRDEFHYAFTVLVVLFLLNPEKNIFHHFIVKMQMLIDFTVFFAVVTECIVYMFRAMTFNLFFPVLSLF